MSLRVTRLLTRLDCWLIRKTRQVQHNLFHCGVSSRRGKETKSWTRNFGPLLDPVQLSYPSFSSQREQDGHITCLEYINLCRKWWNIWKVKNATFFESRNSITPCMRLVSFDSRSRSNRPSAAKIQNNMCWMVGKIQWSCHHPCCVRLCTEPTSIWSPGIVSPMTGRPIV